MSPTLAPLIPIVPLLARPTKYLQMICARKVLLKPAPNSKRRYANEKLRYTGLLPPVSLRGPTSKHPDPMPKRYAAVERFAATVHT
jgi:hypothetical protein